ncbi:MAG TPA: ATP-binding protein [Dehalococcoidia bacterium]|jgi:hypothetical protein|nr:ATP-binding protein [Dehalococcoidia bacterium]
MAYILDADWVINALAGKQRADTLLQKLAPMGITSNLVFSQWGQVFQNPMATAAAIDRVVHHSIILEFDVSSYRTDEARGKQQQVAGGDNDGKEEKE